MKGPNRSSSSCSNDIRHFSAKSNSVVDITCTNICRQIVLRSNFLGLAKTVVTSIDGEYWVLLFDFCFSRKLVARVYVAFFFSFQDNNVASRI